MNNTDKKAYSVKCHICGREFTVMSSFLSLSTWNVRQPDGTVKSFGYGTCNVDMSNLKMHHPRNGEPKNIVAQSYQRGGMHIVQAEW